MNYKQGVTVLIHTLNNESDIYDCLSTILISNPDQVIVADGNSSDRTPHIARELGVLVSSSPPGFHIQQAKAFKQVVYDHLLIIEPDHRFPEGFIENLKNEFLTSEYDGLQASLICTEMSNFWERGISVFYDIHNRGKGKKNIIGGPAIYKSEVHITNLKHENVGFAGDTLKAEQAKEKDLTFGLAHTFAFHTQQMNFETFIKKYLKYGRGDHHFYNKMKKEWSLRRKLQSITHIGRQYFVKYPLIALSRLEFSGALFLILSGFVRYYGWIIEKLYNTKVS